MPTLLSEKTVKARKAHACSCCQIVAVQPGQTYNRATYVNDGRVYDWVSCAECAAISDFVWDWALCPEDEGIGPESYKGWAEDTLAGWGNDENREAAQAFLDRIGGAS